jgi:tellurite resistance protein TehA-like permease
VMRSDMLSYLIAVVLTVGTIVVPVCLFRFVYRFVKKSETRR